jgi:hypothetical protein
VLDPLLLQHAEHGHDVAVSYEHESPNQCEAVVDLAVILDSLIEDVLEVELLLRVRLFNADSGSQ